MKAKIFRFLILSGVIVSICSAHFAFADKNVDSTFEFIKDYFPLRKGNEWTYLVEINGEKQIRTMRIEGKEIVDGIKTIKIDYGNGETDYMVPTNEGLRRYKYTHANGTYRTFFKPKAIILPRTLSMDESYFSNFFYSQFTKDGIHYNSTDQFIIVTLIGLEDVDVPAGKFENCLKVILVEHLGLLNSIGNPLSFDRDIHYSILWFTPGVGLVKEISTFSTAFKGLIESSNKRAELKNAIINGVEIGK